MNETQRAARDLTDHGGGDGMGTSPHLKKMDPRNLITEATAKLMLKAGEQYRYKKPPRVILLRLPDSFTLLMENGETKHGMEGDYLARTGSGLDIFTPEFVEEKFLPAKRRR